MSSVQVWRDFEGQSSSSESSPLEESSEEVFRRALRRYLVEAFACLTSSSEESSNPGFRRALRRSLVGRFANIVSSSEETPEVWFRRALRPNFAILLRSLPVPASTKKPGGDGLRELSPTFPFGAVSFLSLGDIFTLHCCPKASSRLPRVDGTSIGQSNNTAGSKLLHSSLAGCKPNEAC